MAEQQRNLAAIQAYHDRFNAHDLDGTIALVAADALNHGRRAGHRGFRLVIADIFTRFPDVCLEIEEIVAVEDQVIVRNTYAGTHLGVGRLPVDGGLLIGVPPTGRSFSVQHIHWFKMRDGLIAEHRANRDDVGMMVQLGLLTIPPFEWPPADA